MEAKRKATMLRQERESRGWSRQYIAEQVDVDLASIGRSRIEVCRTKVSPPESQNGLCTAPAGRQPDINL